jgi:hypothetical protein
VEKYFIKSFGQYTTETFSSIENERKNCGRCNWWMNGQKGRSKISVIDFLPQPKFCRDLSKYIGANLPIRPYSEIFDEYH